MRILVSQFRCPKCKMPIKHALVENCPRCGVRLTTNFVSQRMILLAIILAISFVFAWVFLLLSRGNELGTSGLIFTMILTAVVISIPLGFLFYKNKKKLQRDKEHIGSSEMVELEQTPVFADVKIDVKLFIVPILSLIAVFTIMYLLISNTSDWGFFIYDNANIIVPIIFLLLAVFGISSFYSFYKFKKDVMKIFEEE